MMKTLALLLALAPVVALAGEPTLEQLQAAQQLCLRFKVPSRGCEVASRHREPTKPLCTGAEPQEYGPDHPECSAVDALIAQRQADVAAQAAAAQASVEAAQAARDQDIAKWTKDLIGLGR